MQSAALFVALLLLVGPSAPIIYIPIKAENRKSIESIRLTSIGQYGIMRKERPGVAAHLHTGIDIMRPGTNFENEPIFSVAAGTVISTRTDGPFAQVIVAHEIRGLKFWTVYEHIAGILVRPGDSVDSQIPFARFMNRTELNKYGQQFNHFHFEVLKAAPIKLSPDARTPTRFYSSHTLECRYPDDLEKYFHDPLGFIKKRI